MHTGTLRHINNCQVDLSRGAVSDPTGNLVILRPQSLAVLAILAEQPGQVITKTALMEAIWPDVAVTDDSLVQCIAEIRKALCDTSHEVIRTLPKRGYVLEEAAVSQAGAAGPRPRSAFPVRRTILAVGIVLLITAIVHYGLLPASGTGRPAIAVLPFENLSADPKWNRFADGMTEDIITDLARYRDIPVIARTSTEAYRGKGEDVRAIGAALKVDYVLEGSLQIDLHRLRVTAQLVEARTGQHVWTERYDRVAGDFFDVQDEITEKIAATLGSWQSPIALQERAVAQRKATDRLTAYDFWLLGTAEKHKMTPLSQKAARALFEKGLLLAPDFEPLVRDLGYTYNIELFLGVAEDPPAARRLLAALAARAIDLDPQDPLAWSLASDSASFENDFDTQRRYVEHALSLGPNNADLLVLSACSAVWIGQAERGPDLADRALLLNPHYPHWWTACLTPAYLYAGQAAKAESFARHLSADAPGDLALQAMIAAELGKSDEAATSAARLLRIDPAWTVEAAFPFPLASDRGRIAASARRAGLRVCMSVDEIMARLETSKTSPDLPPFRYEECDIIRAAQAAN